MNYTKSNIQNISLDFRNIARRLSTTDCSQCASNLKRFMKFIENTPLISEFIREKNTKNYDIKKIIESRDQFDPFQISPDEDEEISFDYQILSYAIQNFNGDFTRLYGGFFYTKARSTRKDEMSTFIQHIVDPFIDYINNYLHRCYKEVCDTDENPSHTTITAENSTVIMGNHVSGNISTQNNNNITIETQETALKCIEAIREQLSTEAIQNKQIILGILEEIKKDISSGKKPRKGFLPTLLSLVSGMATIASLVSTLIQLFPS